MIYFQRYRYFAASCASCHVKPISCSLPITLRLQVVLGHPCFLLLGAVPSKSCFEVHSWSLPLKTCSSHRIRLCWISSTTFWIFFVFLYTELVRPEDVRLEDATCSPEASVVIAFYHSPTLRAIQQTGLTILLYSLSVVLWLYYFDFHTGWNRANARWDFPTIDVLLCCIVLCDKKCYLN